MWCFYSLLPGRSRFLVKANCSWLVWHRFRCCQLHFEAQPHSFLGVYSSGRVRCVWNHCGETGKQGTPCPGGKDGDCPTQIPARSRVQLPTGFESCFVIRNTKKPPWRCQLGENQIHIQIFQSFNHSKELVEEKEVQLLFSLPRSGKGQTLHLPPVAVTTVPVLLWAPFCLTSSVPRVNWESQKLI